MSPAARCISTIAGRPHDSAVFVEDQFTINDKLLLNAGVRTRSLPGVRERRPIRGSPSSSSRSRRPRSRRLWGTAFRAPNALRAVLQQRRSSGRIPISSRRRFAPARSWSNGTLRIATASWRNVYTSHVRGLISQIVDLGRAAHLSESRFGRHPRRRGRIRRQVARRHRRPSQLLVPERQGCRARDTAAGEFGPASGDRQRDRAALPAVRCSPGWICTTWGASRPSTAASPRPFRRAEPDRSPRASCTRA